MQEVLQQRLYRLCLNLLCLLHQTSAVNNKETVHKSPPKKKNVFIHPTLHIATPCAPIIVVMMRLIMLLRPCNKSQNPKRVKCFWVFVFDVTIYYISISWFSIDSKYFAFHTRQLPFASLGTAPTHKAKTRISIWVFQVLRSSQVILMHSPVAHIPLGKWPLTSATSP